jgi:hypothetical protein
MAQKPLNLVCLRTTLDKLMEGHFIRDVLLGGLDRPVRVHAVEQTMAPPFLDDTLLIGLGTAGAAGYLQTARGRGVKNLGFFHMGDEEGKHDRGAYAFADYVIRNYWFEEALLTPAQSLGVIWVPNGYFTGVGPIAPSAVLDTANRQHAGFMAGIVKGAGGNAERQEMARIVDDAKLPFVIFSLPAGTRLGPISYASWLCNSRFALVPGGISPETVRLYDALEAGCIPISLRRPFISAPDALGAPPIVLLDSWKELPAFYEAHKDDVDGLESKRLEIAAWWRDFKGAQQKKVKALIDRGFSRSST